MKKILLIEDDSALSENITTFLTEEGFETKIDANGSQAIHIIDTWKPDLIICDINLPSKGGYEIREEIISNPKMKSIPFIYLTAKVEKDDLRKGMQLGADDYIFKPFDLDDLLNSINIRLEKINQYSSQVNELDDSHIEQYKPEDKVLIKSGSKVQFCFIKDLKYLKSENPYIFLKFADGKSTLIRQTLNDWEEKLPPKLFIRIHRSTIINIDFIRKISRLDNSSYKVTLVDEDEFFTISKRYSARLRDLLI